MGKRALGRRRMVNWHAWADLQSLARPADLIYEDQLEELLKKRTGGKVRRREVAPVHTWRCKAGPGRWVLLPAQGASLLQPAPGHRSLQEDEVAKVALKKYQRVNPSAFGLVGKKAIGVLRASGAITAGGYAMPGAAHSHPHVFQQP